MRKAWTVWTLCVAMLAACGGGSAADAGGDAALRPDSDSLHDIGIIDAGADASVADLGADANDAAIADLDTDAGNDDAGAAQDAGADAAACSVAPQSGCGTGLACRFSTMNSDGSTSMPGQGIAECESHGTLAEGSVATSPGACSDVAGPGGTFRDLCQAGLFCWTVCRRYCDPAGAPCPDLHGSPQSCVHYGGTCSASPIWYCEGGPPVDWGCP